MNSRLHSLSAGLAVLAVIAAPNLDVVDCGNTADRYAVAAARVLDALHGFERCLSKSDRHDDCAAEMQALDDAHDAFADVVADAKECR